MTKCKIVDVQHNKITFSIVNDPVNTFYLDCDHNFKIGQIIEVSHSNKNGGEETIVRSAQ